MKGKKKTTIFKLVKNKYFIVGFLFLIWLFFFDEYSILAQFKNRKQLQNLTEQQQYYKDRIQADQRKLKELNSGVEELEKYAREQFYMSKPDEDLYIIGEEGEE